MLPYKDLKEIYSDIKKDKIMIWLLRTFGSIITLMLIVASIRYGIGAHSGNHVKMFYGLIEDNIPKEHPDTIYKDKLLLKIRVDTVFKIKYIKSSVPITNNTKIDHPDKVEIGTTH